MVFSEMIFNYMRELEEEILLELPEEIDINWWFEIEKGVKGFLKIEYIIPYSILGMEIFTPQNGRRDMKRFIQYEKEVWESYLDDEDVELEVLYKIRY